MQNVNVKKPLKLRNRTKYFDPDKDCVQVTFSSPDTFQSRNIKIEGYETRLYWQFKYCEDVGGQSFFYTLTYNDEHIPKYLDFNCFDYEDLRDLFTGGFRKQLLRKYGTTFKYFVGAELGDGKGERGLHNNPHYHVIFFLEDAKNEKFPYVVISPLEFRHLVRMYWQGFDEDEDLKKGIFHSYKDAKFGICREGENLGKIVDHRACMYCAKYVCKDAKLKMAEDKVVCHLRSKLRQELNLSEEIFKDFFIQVVRPMFNIPKNANNTEWFYSDFELFRRLLPDSIIPDDFTAYSLFVEAIIRQESLWKEYNEFLEARIEEKVSEGLSEYRNRYCNKCRISHGVGDYALKFVDDKLEPLFKVPTKDGFKYRPACMYYYRKLFTEVHKDVKGSNIRVLNDLGMKYKVEHLKKRLLKKEQEAITNLSLAVCDKDLYDKLILSDVNTDVSFSYSEFCHELQKLINVFPVEKILERYAQYKLVYEGRYFSFKFLSNSDVSVFPDINVFDDYKRFIVPSYFSVSRSDLRLEAFLVNTPSNCLPYQSHPYFLRFIGVFNVLDLVSDYLFVQTDNEKQRIAEELAKVKRFHDKMKLKDFYLKYKS